MKLPSCHERKVVSKNLEGRRNQDGRLVFLALITLSSSGVFPCFLSYPRVLPAHFFPLLDNNNIANIYQALTMCQVLC